MKVTGPFEESQPILESAISRQWTHILAMGQQGRQQVAEIIANPFAGQPINIDESLPFAEEPQGKEEVGEE